MYEKVVEHKKLPLYWSHFQGPLTPFWEVRLTISFLGTFLNGVGTLSVGLVNFGQPI